MTVSELNTRISSALNKDPIMKSVTVRGEISGFKHHISSGHWYMSLKDENASISCVMYRQNTLKQKTRPKDGDLVIANGYVDMYQKSGQVQLYILSMEPSGTGDLHIRYEILKRQLFNEGLFDPSRKKTLPMVPRKVAVITSESGAAIHDILNVSAMRNPAIPIVIIPVAVQGNNAACEIANAVYAVNRMDDIDVIIVGRGGGSLEDLWCFNEEIVGRAIADSRIPVVTGIGHEIDFTICDFIADVRASTPSNAAEIVFPDRNELHERNQLLRSALCKCMSDRINNDLIRLRSLTIKMKDMSPEKLIREQEHKTQILFSSLKHTIMLAVTEQFRIIEGLKKRLSGAIDEAVIRTEARLHSAEAELNAISPMGVLDRGYTLVYTKEHKILTDAKSARKEDLLAIRFKDGTVNVIRKD